MRGMKTTAKEFHRARMMDHDALPAVGAGQLHILSATENLDRINRIYGIEGHHAPF